MRYRLVLACSLAACAERPPAPPEVPATPPTAAAPPAAEQRPAFAYPPARRDDVVDDHHGLKVADPYRWLESLDSPETQRWIAAENQLTDSVLGGLPALPLLKKRIDELNRYTRFGLPVRRGGRWFWTQRDPGQEQQVLYTAPSRDAQPSVLVDVNAISPDGKQAFAGFSVSADGRRVAYGLSAGGGDWQTWRLRDTRTGADLADALPFVKYYTPQLSPDGRHVFYSRFPAPEPGKELSETDHDCKVYDHAVGTPASSDVVVYERPDHPSWQFAPSLSPDGETLVIAVGDGEVGDRGVERIVTVALGARPRRPVAVVDNFDAEYELAGVRGRTLYLKTTSGAPKKRVVALDLGERQPAAHEIVAQGDDAIEDAVLAGDRLLVTTLKDARHALAVYDLSGKKAFDVALPGLGTLALVEGGPKDADAFFAFRSYTAAGTVYHLDLARGASTVWREPKVAFAPGDFETRQVWFRSKDGTKVPMFITSRKGLSLDGTNPTLLYGYGGFGVSVTPKLDTALIAWLEEGGVLAVANLRGGGEFGEAWHRAATREKKQTSFDDFIAAAEWLESNGYTSRPKLGIYGRSGGGLLVGAVAMERPDLFGAVAPLAGVLDMARFPLFGQGAGWEGDFGSPENPDELKAILAYSPLHNVRRGVYPATYIVTADHDARVAPLHSYKFAAALQAAQTGPAPILLRVETTSGHGGGTTASSHVDQSAELLAFFSYALHVAPPGGAAASE